MFIPFPVIVIGAILILSMMVWALRRGGARNANELSAPRSAKQIQSNQIQSSGPSREELEPAWQPGPAPVISDADKEKLRDMALAGQKIQAIKIAREMTGLGLAEAKAFVERLEAVGR